MRALFIGRFQPFHKGHLEIIKKAAENDEVVIVIGSSQYSNTEDNPFSSKQRTEMIKRALKEEGIKNYRIVSVPDIDCDDGWVRHVLKHTSYIDVVYAAENQKTRKLFKEAGYKVVTTKRLFKLSSTDIRKRMKEGKKWQDTVPKTVVEYLRIVSNWS